MDAFKVFWSSNNLPVVFVVANIFGPGFDRDIKKLIFGFRSLLDDQVAFLVKHPPD
jgi:hypothetical protein